MIPTLGDPQWLVQGPRGLQGEMRGNEPWQLLNRIYFGNRLASIDCPLRRIVAQHWMMPTMLLYDMDIGICSIALLPIMNVSIMT